MKNLKTILSEIISSTQDPKFKEITDKLLKKYKVQRYDQLNRHERVKFDNEVEKNYKYGKRISI